MTPNTEWLVGPVYRCAAVTRSTDRPKTEWARRSCRSRSWPAHEGGDSARRTCDRQPRPVPYHQRSGRLPRHGKDRQCRMHLGQFETPQRPGITLARCGCFQEPFVSVAVVIWTVPALIGRRANRPSPGAVKAYVESTSSSRQRFSLCDVECGALVSCTPAGWVQLRGRRSSGLLSLRSPRQLGVARALVAGPFGEGDRADQAGLHPLGAVGVHGRYGGGERAPGAAQRSQSSGQAGEHGLGEAGADVPGIPQAAAVRHAEQQRADRAGPATAAGPSATDDELGVADVRDLDSVPSLAGMVGRGQRPADHALQAVGQVGGPQSADPPGYHGGSGRALYPGRARRAAPAARRTASPPAGRRRPAARRTGTAGPGRRGPIGRSGGGHACGTATARSRGRPPRTAMISPSTIPGMRTAREYAQLGIAVRHVVAVTAHQPQPPSADIGDHAAPVPLEFHPYRS